VTSISDAAHAEGQQREPAIADEPLMLRPAERHESVGPAVLFLRQHVDGHAIHGHVLGRTKEVQHEAQRGEHGEVLQRLREEGEGHPRQDQPQLREDDPRPAPPHCEEREAVHQGPGQDLEAPGSMATP
jgi:hypothetical protein